MGLFEIYLAGWLIFSGVGAYKCEGNHAVGKEMCVVMNVGIGAVWPVVVPIVVVSKLKAL